MNNKVIWLGLLVVLIVGAVLPMGKQNKTVVERVIENVGAVPGPDMSFPFIGVNGVRVWPMTAKMNAASTTLCAFKTPTATTTIIRSYSLQIETATATAAHITIATSTKSAATSTSNALVSNYGVPANTGTTIAGVPANQLGILAPSEYLLFMTAGAGLGGYTYGGSCNALFEEI